MIFFLRAFLLASLMLSCMIIESCMAQWKGTRDYVYDSKTTYCVWLNQSLNVTNTDPTYIEKEGVDKECPVTIALTQIDSNVNTKIYPLKDVSFSWKVSLNIPNKFNLSTLNTVPDGYTGIPSQIAHSNLHACARSSVCDMFSDGFRPKKTEQQSSNFSAGTASFTDKLQFDQPGEYVVLAHIILPAENVTTDRYDFVTFTTVTVQGREKDEENPKTMSTASVIGLIVGGITTILALLVVGVFYKRKKKEDDCLDPFANSGFAPSVARSKISRMGGREGYQNDMEYPWKDDDYASVTGGSNQDFRLMSSSALTFQDTGYRGYGGALSEHDDFKCGRGNSSLRHAPCQVPPTQASIPASQHRPENDTYVFYTGTSTEIFNTQQDKNMMTSQSYQNESSIHTRNQFLSTRGESVLSDISSLHDYSARSMGSTSINTNETSPHRTLDKRSNSSAGCQLTVDVTQEERKKLDNFSY
jgi:hypothetical protein